MKKVSIFIVFLYSLINAGAQCPESTSWTAGWYPSLSAIELVEKNRTTFPKVYLWKKGFSLFPRYSYGYSPDGPYTGIGVFGHTLGREINVVPDAATSMKAYTWTGAGSCGLIVGGLCLFIGSAVYAARHSQPNADGTYDAQLPQGIPVGFALVVVGALAGMVRPFFLYQAVRAYNRKAHE